VRQGFRTVVAAADVIIITVPAGDRRADAKALLAYD